MKDLLSIIDSVKPTALIGVGAVPKVFSEKVIKRMAALNKRPVIMALSNPTHKAECTAEEAYRFSEGRAIFASGSPFDKVQLNGVTHVPGQCNNSYIFPGVGLAVTFCRSLCVTEEHFVIAAHALAESVSQKQLDSGCLFPPLAESRVVSLLVATRVAQNIIDNNHHRLPVVPKDAAALKQCISDFRYEPNRKAKL